MNAFEKTAAAAFLSELEKIAEATQAQELVEFLKLSSIEKEAILKRLFGGAKKAKDKVTEKVRQAQDKANEATIKAYVKSPEPVQKGIQKGLWFMRDPADHSPGIAAGSIFKNLFGG